MNASSTAKPLRVFVYSLNYAPELTGVGKYSGELVGALADSGVEVVVVTAQPYYPGWRIFEGFSNRYSIERPRPGVTVYRCPLYVPGVPSGGRRLIHHASFVLSTLPLIARLLLWRPDVVWVVQPSLMCTPAAFLVARLAGAKCWLHIQDFEVDAAFGLGLIKSEWLKKCALGIERWLIRRFDVVSAISTKMVELANRKGVDARKLVLFPNWVELEQVRHVGANRYREELGVSLGTKLCLYSGNMGQKQGLEVLAQAAHLLVRRDDIRFLFCGEGSGRTTLIEMCRGLTNVTFLPLQPAEHLAELLGSADVHLLPQRADVTDLVMPSKLGGMLASGRPVVATAQKGSEVDRIVAQCGVAVTPGNVQAFSGAIEALIDNPALARQLGTRGREYALANLERKSVMAKFVHSLTALCQESVGN